MARTTIYVGLEIGTSKVCVVVGEVKGDGAIKLLGVGQAPSRGVRKGEIVDFSLLKKSPGAHGYCAPETIARNRSVLDPYAQRL